MEDWRREAGRLHSQSTIVFSYSVYNCRITVIQTDAAISVNTTDKLKMTPETRSQIILYYVFFFFNFFLFFYSLFFFISNLNMFINAHILNLIFKKDYNIIKIKQIQMSFLDMVFKTFLNMLIHTLCFSV